MAYAQASKVPLDEVVQVLEAQTDLPEAVPAAAALRSMAKRFK